MANSQAGGAAFHISMDLFGLWEESALGNHGNHGLKTLF